MSAVDISKDLENARLTITTTFAASPDRVWQLWADPRQLERWWGPDPYPATVVDHDLRPGGHVSYYMTGPEGDQHKGYWRVVEVDPPNRLTFEDGFADDTGAPNDDLPVSRSEVEIAEVAEGRTRMTVTSIYDTTEALEQVIAMGMEQGITTALEQAHAFLAQA